MRWSSWPAELTCLAALFFLVSWAASAQEPVTLHYYERPPFLIRQSDGSASGLIGSRVSQLFHDAGMTIRWELTPANRQLHLLKKEGEAACGIGWYKTPQRETFARFSHPLYRDRGTVIIANFSVHGEKYHRFADLLADESLSILLKDGLTYGGKVAGLLRSAKAHTEPVAVEQPQMVRMIASGRASLMFATREEAEMLLTGGERRDQGVQLLTFEDLPATGEPRYLMCGKSVAPSILARIDAAIDRLPQP